MNLPLLPRRHAVECLVALLAGPACGGPQNLSSANAPQAPGPAPVAAGPVRPSGPVTLEGAPIRRALATPGQPWVMLGLPETTRWWSRESGEAGPELVGIGKAPACMASDGVVVAGVGGAMLRWKLGEAEAARIDVATAPAPRQIACAASGAWIAWLADDLRVIDDRGATVWTGAEARAVGFAGDRLRYLDPAGTLFELKLPAGEPTPVGEVADVASGTWQLAPDGGAVRIEARRVTVHPPAQLGGSAGSALPATFDLDTDVIGVAWLDLQRLLVFDDAGAHLFLDGRPLTEGGELTGSDPLKAAWK